jgi:hypothetical protein
LIPDSRRQYGFENWTFDPLPPTSVWDIDQDVIVSHDFFARPILYNFKIGFYRRGEGGYGKEIDLGWMEDTGLTDEELLEEIKQADNIIDLATVQRKIKLNSSALSLAINRILKDKWSKLLEDCHPIQSNFGVDLIKFQYRKILDDKYQISYLIKVNKSFNSDYRIFLHGYVDNNHLQFLSPERRKYKFENWKEIDKIGDGVVKKHKVYVDNKLNEGDYANVKEETRCFQN